MAVNEKSSPGLGGSPTRRSDRPHRSSAAERLPRLCRPMSVESDSVHRATYAFVSLRHRPTGCTRWPAEREQYAGSCWNLRAGPRIIGCVAETIEALERRIDELRVAVREAVLSGDPALAK